MEFFLTRADFVKLTTICSRNSAEQAGIMTFKEDNNDYFFSGFEILDQDSGEIKANRPWSVTFNITSYLPRIIYEVIHGQDSEGVVVRFHTHPKKFGIDGAAIPSKADEQHIKAVQESVDNINKKFGKQFTFVEGIISDSEIGFYYYEDGEIKRVNTFVDFVELVPRKRKGVFSSFVDGVKEGMGR